MQPNRHAVIDVGTNSVKVLIGDVGAHGEVTPVLEESHQTRLGAGFYETRRLESERIVATAETVKEFAAKAHEFGADDVCVFATSAAREAVNGHELAAAIKERAGLTTRIISGAEEATRAFEGATTDPRYADGTLLLNDIGGGSAQFIIGKAGRLEFAGSYALGTVRLVERIRPGDPPGREQLETCRELIAHVLETEVRPQIADLLTRPTSMANPDDAKPKWVATGGSATILGCMEKNLTRFDRAALESVVLAPERLRFHLERLWSMRLVERQHIPGLPPNRADVILTGVAIYCGIAEAFDFDALRLSTRGLRFGMLRCMGTGAGRWGPGGSD